MMKAMGFIETMGLLAAIEAADAMLKAADVTLVDKSLASGGLVTISVSGEVAAVKAAVDAAAASLDRLPGAVVVSKHVIARPDCELAKIIAKKDLVQEASATPAPADPAPTAPASPKPAPAAPARQTSGLKAKATTSKKGKPSGKKK